MRRLPAAGLSLVLLLTIPTAMQAQLGGLKKKLADKVTGKQPDTTVATGATGSKPKCDKSTLVITGDVVDRYLKALAARTAEIRRIAREPGPVGAYYAAYLKREDIERRKSEFDLRRGPDWERYKVLYPKFAKGDQAAMREQRGLMDSLDASRVEVPELEWEAQRKNGARIDSLMMAASGISYCDWSGNGIGDRMPMLVNLLYNDPDTRDLRGYGTPLEGAAVKARLTELAAGLGYSRGRSPTQAEKAHIAEEDEKLQRAAMLTGDPYTDCVTRVQQDFVKKHQAEMDKASKDKDAAASMRLAQLIGVETLKECKKYSKDKDKDDDE